MIRGREAHGPVGTEWTMCAGCCYSAYRSSTSTPSKGVMWPRQDNRGIQFDEKILTVSCESFIYGRVSIVSAGLCASRSYLFVIDALQNPVLVRMLITATGGLIFTTASSSESTSHGRASLSAIDTIAEITLVGAHAAMTANGTGDLAMVPRHHWAETLGAGGTSTEARRGRVQIEIAKSVEDGVGVVGTKRCSC